MRKPDFTYTSNGDGFVSLWPENKDAENQINMLMEGNGGSNKFFFLHWPTIRKGLKKHGWIVHKAKPSPKISDLEILEQLGL